MEIILILIFCVLRSWKKHLETRAMWTEPLYIHSRSTTLVSYLEDYGPYISSLRMEMDADITVIKTFELFAKLIKVQHLEKLTLMYKPPRQPFECSAYGSQLKLLFQSAPQRLSHLRELDLSKTIMPSSIRVMEILAEHNPHLEKLNIDCELEGGRALGSTTVLMVVQACRKLVDVSLSLGSISDALLLAFAQEQRAPLKNFYISYRYVTFDFYYSFSTKSFLVLVFFLCCFHMFQLK